MVALRSSGLKTKGNVMGLLKSSPHDTRMGMRDMAARRFSPRHRIYIEKLDRRAWTKFGYDACDKMIRKRLGFSKRRRHDISYRRSFYFMRCVRIGANWVQW